MDKIMVLPHALQSHDVAIVIPQGLIPAFAEVLRRGMAYEHGQPEELYRFEAEFRAVLNIPAPIITP